MNGPGSNADQAGGFENAGALRQLNLHPLFDLCGDLGPPKLNVVRLSSPQARHDTLAYQRPFELGKHAHHLKEGSSCRRCGIDGLLMEVQADFERMDLSQETKQILERTAEAMPWSM
jgi:hypothetical protein